MLWSRIRHHQLLHVCWSESAIASWISRIEIMTGDVDNDVLRERMPDTVGGITVVKTHRVREDW